LWWIVDSASRRDCKDQLQSDWTPEAPRPSTSASKLDRP
jgi:hypothetical protein